MKKQHLQETNFLLMRLGFVALFLEFKYLVLRLAYLKSNKEELIKLQKIGHDTLKSNGYNSQTYKELEKVQAAIDKLKSDRKIIIGQVRRNSAAVIGISLSSLIIYIGYRTYKEHLSAAARACKDKIGQEKNKCMQDFKKFANIKRLNLLRKEVSKCSVSKNEEVCKRKVNNEIRRIQSKIK